MSCRVFSLGKLTLEGKQSFEVFSLGKFTLEEIQPLTPAQVRAGRVRLVASHELGEDAELHLAWCVARQRVS